MALSLTSMAAALPFTAISAAEDPVAAAEAELALRPHAQDEVWRTLIAGGLPLVRPDPEHADRVRATFLYRGEAESVRLDSVLNAVEVSGPVTDYHRDFALAMQRIAGTDIWWRTLSVPAQVEAVYSYRVEQDGVMRRYSDHANPRRLRGRDAESVFLASPSNVHPAVRPVSLRQRIAADVFQLDSDWLGRSVEIATYAPGGAGAEAPVLIIYDSFLWGERAPAVEIVQNLITRERIPPLHVVLIDQLDPGSAAHLYSDQMGFLLEELDEALAARGLGGPLLLAGASRRGLVATMAGLQGEGRIAGVFSLSGSFYWAPDGEEAEWLSRQLAPAPDAAPRFILSAGTLETVVTPTTNRGHIMLDTNRNMAAALQAAGYQAEFHMFEGGHDIAGWRTALALALERYFEPAD